MSNFCEIDTRGIDNILKNLDENNRKNAIKSSLSDVANYIQQQTRMQLRKQLGSGASSSNHGYRPMEQGIYVKERKDEELTFSVNLYGDFRLKWFEMGTKLRKILRGKKSKDKKDLSKKRITRIKGNLVGANRGRITGLHFFRNVRMSGDIINRLINNLDKEISKLIR